MNPKTQEVKDRVTTDLQAGKKAVNDAMARVQSQIDAANAEVNKLRADLKTQAADAKAKTKTMARIDELTKNLDASYKEQQNKIEARLKQLHTDTESLNTELKHAAAAGKVAVEAEAKAVREEYDNMRSSLTASLDAELTELKSRIGTAREAATEKGVAAKADVQAKITDLHGKYEAAQKKVHALKQASTTAFDELQHGARAAVGEVKTAVQHARADIAAAS